LFIKYNFKISHPYQIQILQSYKAGKSNFSFLYDTIIIERKIPIERTINVEHEKWWVWFWWVLVWGLGNECLSYKAHRIYEMYFLNYNKVFFRNITFRFKILCGMLYILLQLVCNSFYSSFFNNFIKRRIRMKILFIAYVFIIIKIVIPNLF